MKKLVVLLMLTLFVGSAFAQVDPDQNSIGFYWDMGATITETTLDPYQDLYVLITNPTFDQFAGVEFAMDWDDAVVQAFPMFLAGSDWTNYGDSHQVIIGFGSPYPTSPITLIGTLTLKFPSAPVYFRIGGLDQPSLPTDLPIVALDQDNLLIIGTSVGAGNIAAMMGDTGVVPAESETWGGVKSLYR